MTGAGGHRLPAGRDRAPCSPRCPASASTATTTPPPPSPPGRSRCSPPGRCPARRGRRRRRHRRARRAGPGVVAGAARARPSSGITGSSGKTSTKDLTAQVVERLGPTVAPDGSFNNELGLPLTVLRADERDPVPGAGDVRPRARAHRLPVRHRAAPDRRGAERRPRARRGVRLARRGGQGQGRARRGAARRRGRGTERRRPPGPGDGRPHRGPRGDLRRAGPRRRVRATDVRLDDLGRPRSRWSRPRPGRGDAAAARRAPRAERAGRRRHGRRARPGSGRYRGRADRRDRPQQEADGGQRAGPTG